MDKLAYFKQLEEYKNAAQNISAVIVKGAGTGDRFFISDGKRIGKTDTITEKDFPVPKQTGLTEWKDKTIFAEVLHKQPQLIICGAGHVSQRVIPLAKSIGFAVTVLEDRPSFADMARAAGADCVLCNSFENSLEKIQGSAAAYFLVVTRGHRYDAVCLKRILKKPRAYVGMMASRGRAALLKKELAAEGEDPGALDAIHTPVGLAIHAETPQEIAVSIAAELIQTKNHEKKSEGYGALLPYLTGETDPDKQKVLATIIERSGSAPRSIGTKMLVLEDGRLEGTLGGGCMEADIRQKCLHMLKHPEIPDHMEQADLTAAQVESEGLVCGGRIHVFLERV